MTAIVNKIKIYHDTLLFGIEGVLGKNMVINLDQLFRKENIKINKTELIYQYHELNQNFIKYITG